MRGLLYKALEAYLQGNIEKHVANVKLQAENTSGVADHPDQIATIEGELKKIGEFVGHKHITMTELYTHLNTTDMKEILSKV